MATIGEAKVHYQRAELREARHIYEQLDASGELTDPDDLSRLGTATMFSGDPVTARRCLERAFVAHQNASDPQGAAETALWLFRLLMDLRDEAVAFTWFKRAERLLQDAPPGRSHVQLVVMQSLLAGFQNRWEEALELAQEALRIAREVGDRDGQAMALNRCGRTLIRLGRTDEGRELLDESMAAVTTDALDPGVSFLVYCSTISGYTDLADYARATQWTDAANAWCDAKRFSGMPGICRVHRAELLRLRGHLQDAEREALEAGEMLRRANMKANAGESLGELGMVRLRTGNLEGAETAFKEAHLLGHEPQPGLALLRLRRGHADSAAASIERAVEERRQDPLGRAKLLPAQVEIEVARGRLESADAAATDLQGIAERFDSPGLAAAALAARGRVQLARGDREDAVATLRRALTALNDLDAPYEAACVRRLLATAYEQQGDSEQAQMELDTAQGTFETMGANPELALHESGPVHVAIDETIAVRPPTQGPIGPGCLLEGKIAIERELGSGAMGAVYAGRHQIMDREVAVKVVHERLAADSEHRARLLQEAQACARIKHSNVIDVYDAGICNDTPYLVMELLRGESLAERLDRETRLSIPDAVDLVCQALDGVAAAHAMGVIHRDLKPANLFLSTGEQQVGPVVKVLDFGISKLSTDSHARTRTGAILGTPYYMAPEQAEAAEDVDGRADVYSMAAVLYELLTGDPPFTAETYPALLLKIVSEDFPSACSLRDDVPEELDRILRRAGNRSRDERIATPLDFAAELRAASGRLL